jgi:uncharacterized protein
VTRWRLSGMAVALGSSIVLSGTLAAACGGVPIQATPGCAGCRTIAVGIGTPALTATLTVPAGRGPFPAVLLVSGSGQCDQDEHVGPDRPFLDLAGGLAAGGVATLRYDKRTRDYPHTIDMAIFTPTQEYVPDAVAAIELLRARPEIDPRRVFVLGHSDGGTFAPLIARAAPQVAGVVLMAAVAESPGRDLVRQVAYLATLPGAIGTSAQAELPDAEQAEQQIDSPDLATASPTAPMSPLLGGTEPAYWVDWLRYDEVATARALPQPLLLLQGDRDFQVTVADDLDVWLNGLAGRPGVTVRQYAQADHLFVDGTGPPTPADYDHPAHVDPAVAPDIAAWVRSMDQA